MLHTVLVIICLCCFVAVVIVMPMIGSPVNLVIAEGTVTFFYTKRPLHNVGQKDCPCWTKRRNDMSIADKNKTKNTVRRKKDSGDGTTWEKKKRKTEAEMDGLCRPRHDSYWDNER